MEGVFTGVVFNEDINMGLWEVSNVENMSYMFVSPEYLGDDVSLWNTSNVITMRGMFESACIFNRNIDGWKIQPHDDTYRMLKYSARDNKQWTSVMFM